MPVRNRDSGLHKDHRKRMKQQFLAGGIDQFTTHQVLELLLFYSIPRRDTNETAHRLIDRFGSISNVLDAEYEELRQVEGVGEHTATFLMYCGQLLSRYYKEKNENKRVVGLAAIKEFLINEYINEKREKVYLLSLNNRSEMLNATVINVGTPTSSDADIREMVEVALRYHASGVVLAHNHPVGNNAPSNADIMTTKKAIAAFRMMNISLSDHLIYGDGEVFSMRESPYYAPMFSDLIQRLAD